MNIVDNILPKMEERINELKANGTKIFDSIFSKCVLTEIIFDYYKEKFNGVSQELDRVLERENGSSPYSRYKRFLMQEMECIENFQIGVKQQLIWEMDAEKSMATEEPSMLIMVEESMIQAEKFLKEIK
jgi:hypothetical protein